MKKYKIRILIGSIIPLISIFLFPFLNIKTSIALFVYMIFMFGGYLLVISLPEKDKSYFDDKKYGCH
ncbi:hypothetical protein MNBD_UNCLBAC01-1055 [hydrothermal vent metagenome]|uniref:Uncharacterized protein n=1 Tax=hydrothermal vent metagenome TaxID=652676 RepID=A0A3B1E222_9ZZZZ